MNNLQTIAFGQFYLLPESSRNNLTVALHGDSVQLHPMFLQKTMQYGAGGLSYVYSLAIEEDRHNRCLEYQRKASAARC